MAPAAARHTADRHASAVSYNVELLLTIYILPLSITSDINTWCHKLLLLFPIQSLYKQCSHGHIPTTASFILSQNEGPFSGFTEESIYR